MRADLNKGGLRHIWIKERTLVSVAMFVEMPRFEFTETGFIQNKVSLSSTSEVIHYLLHLFGYFFHQ